MVRKPSWEKKPIVLKSKKGRGREFDVPARFDIEKHMERGPWEFEGGQEQWAQILFHKDVAFMMEEGLTPGRKFERRSDGSGVLHIKVRKSPQTHQRMLGLLAPYSGQCAVLKPAWLRKQAMDHLKKLREQYS